MESSPFVFSAGYPSSIMFWNLIWMVGMLISFLYFLFPFYYVKWISWYVSRESEMNFKNRLVIFFPETEFVLEKYETDFEIRFISFHVFLMKWLLGSVSYFFETDHEFRFTNFKFCSKNRICDPFQKSMKQIPKSVS